MRFSSLLVPTLLALCAATASVAQPAYKQGPSVALGAPDRWDYVVFDGDTNRVYVAHGDRVTPVDPASGAVVDQISVIAGGTHGIAIST